MMPEPTRTFVVNDAEFLLLQSNINDLNQQKDAATTPLEHERFTKILQILRAAPPILPNYDRRLTFPDDDEEIIQWFIDQLYQMLNLNYGSEGIPRERLILQDLLQRMRMQYGK